MKSITRLIGVLLSMGALVMLTGGPSGAATPGPKNPYVPCTVRYVDTYHDGAAGRCTNNYYSYRGKAQLWIKCGGPSGYFWVDQGWTYINPRSSANLPTFRCASGPIYAVTYSSAYA